MTITASYSYQSQCNYLGIDTQPYSIFEMFYLLVNAVFGFRKTLRKTILAFGISPKPLGKVLLSLEKLLEKPLEKLFERFSNRNELIWDCLEVSY